MKPINTILYCLALWGGPIGALSADQDVLRIDAESFTSSLKYEQEGQFKALFESPEHV